MAELSAYLSDAEIDDICAPLQVGAAKCKHLQRLGLIVKRKANGRPLVARAEFERVMTGGQLIDQETKSSTSQPDVVGLQDFFQKRKNGTRTQGR
ncbi:hypothetical protein [Diaphorobacter caeni]|uniref:hypothetical protein n=1 Tax=Diaphorobacter caeni TaxID=2784387 RepID=UPI00188E9D61|nr:hypothetical protein [Diaphorobacter caeni]MBF5006893.1 hypothetical protein [Diaphorobacter caeni]